MSRWDPRKGAFFTVLVLAGAVAIAGCGEGVAPPGPAASERLATERPSAAVALASPSEAAATAPSSPTASETAIRQPPSGLAQAAATWTVVAVIDGDTVDVSSSEGIEERVRIIGIDTPEQGECGFTAAAEALSRLVLNQRVTLVAGARDDRDRYDRILRYLDAEFGDAGLQLIRDGLAVARYDSRDGYGRHAREDAYVAADAVTGQLCGVDNPPAPQLAPSSPPGNRGLPVQTFRNCAELNVIYPGGIARSGVTGNTVSGQLRPFGMQPVFDDVLYEANTARDGDRDGIACER